MWVSKWSILVPCPSSSLDQPEVPDDTRGDQPDVEIRRAHRDEAHPGEEHVPGVQYARSLPGSVPRLREGGAGEAIETPPHQMTGRVAGEAVERERGGVGEQHERADADPEVAVEDRRARHVAPEKREVEERRIEEVAVKVLEDEGKRGLTPVAGAMRLGHGTRRRIEEVGAVVGLPVVVAGGPEEHRREQDQERG